MRFRAAAGCLGARHEIRRLELSRQLDEAAEPLLELRRALEPLHGVGVVPLAEAHEPSGIADVAEEPYGSGACALARPGCELRPGLNERLLVLGGDLEPSVREDLVHRGEDLRTLPRQRGAASGRGTSRIARGSRPSSASSDTIAPRLTAADATKTSDGETASRRAPSVGASASPSHHVSPIAAM